MWRNIFNFIVKVTGYPIYLLIFKPRLHYEDRSVQGRRIHGKAIVMSNHMDVWDVAVMLFTFLNRNLRCIVAELMFEKNFFMTFFLKSLGAIRVDRNSHDFAFIQKSCDILDHGGVVEIYPEARIPKKNEEKPLEFKPSVAYMALMSGAPIIPVYTDGRYFCKERNNIIIGKPIDVSVLYDTRLSEQENIKNITEILRNKVLELRDELDNRTKAK